MKLPSQANRLTIGNDNFIVAKFEYGTCDIYRVYEQVLPGEKGSHPKLFGQPGSWKLWVLSMNKYRRNADVAAEMGLLNEDTHFQHQIITGTDAQESLAKALKLLQRDVAARRSERSAMNAYIAEESRHLREFVSLAFPDEKRDSECAGAMLVIPKAQMIQRRAIRDSIKAYGT